MHHLGLKINFNLYEISILLSSDNLTRVVAMITILSICSTYSLNKDILIE